MVEFYHYLFYKSYLWQVKVMKEIDYPIYSAVIMITFILSLNYSMIYEFVSYFIYHNRWTWEYPWVYYFPLGALFVLNYWYFSKNSRWKSVVKWGNEMPRIEKRGRNIYYLIYIVFTILAMVSVAYARMNNILRY